MTAEVAIVTGAGSGIGKATAVQLAAGGHHVVCADIDGEAAERSAREIGNGTATPCQADVSRDEDCRLLADLAAKKGSLRTLCNVAGICPPGTGITKVTEETWDRVFAVNVKAIFLLSRACVPSAGRGPPGEGDRQCCLGACVRRPTGERAVRGVQGRRCRAHQANGGGPRKLRDPGGRSGPWACRHTNDPSICSCSGHRRGFSRFLKRRAKHWVVRRRS